MRRWWPLLIGATVLAILLTGCLASRECTNATGVVTCSEKPLPFYQQPWFWLLGPGEIALTLAGFIVFLPFGLWKAYRDRKAGRHRLG